LPAVEDYQGTVAYLLGMGWHEKRGRFDELNRALHRITLISTFDTGLAKLTSWQPGGGRQVQAAVDMNQSLVAATATSTSRPDLGEDAMPAWKNFLWLDNAGLS